jgi:hypothetical protein
MVANTKLSGAILNNAERWPDRVSVMDDGEYKNIRNVFERWSEATMARRVSVMDDGE